MNQQKAGEVTVINKSLVIGGRKSKVIFEFNEKMKRVARHDNIKAVAKAHNEKDHFAIYECLRKRRLYKNSYFSYEEVFSIPPVAFQF